MIDFDKLISDYLKRENKPKTPGRYYPSECGSCLRKAHYSYLHPREVDQDLVKVFHAGDMLHEFLVDVFKSEKTEEVELIESETPFTLEQEGFVIAGRIDDLLLIKLSGEKVLVEVKSTSRLDYCNEPHDSHVLQLQIYLHATKMQKGIILYVEKNTLKTKSFPLNYDESLAQKALGRFKLLHDSLTHNNLPDPEARIIKSMNWLCRNCPYKEKCYEATPKSEELP